MNTILRPLEHSDFVASNLGCKYNLYIGDANVTIFYKSKISNPLKIILIEKMFIFVNKPLTPFQNLYNTKQNKNPVKKSFFYILELQ